jgi:hypothetical protein
MKEWVIKVSSDDEIWNVLDAQSYTHELNGWNTVDAFALATERPMQALCGCDKQVWGTRGNI